MKKHFGDSGERIGIVLSGAAARGAFQAGALAELLPAIGEDRAPIVLGTSAGAINTAFYGAHAHQPAQDTADELERVWGRMSHTDVYRPIITGSVLTGLQFACGAVLGRGGGTTSLLDTDPLTETANDLIDMRRLHRNVIDGRLTAVGVVATRVPPANGRPQHGTSSSGTVIFLDEHEPSDFEGDPDRKQRVARGPIRTEHVIASSAIPVAFPAQRVTRPKGVAGWYIDGGVRLNAPLRPAIALGATKLIVISATSTTYGPELPADTSPAIPDAADAAAQSMNAVLADRLTEDLLTLRRTNRMVDQVAELGDDDESPLRSSDGRPYRTIEFLTVSPPPGELGRLATRIFDEKTSGLGRLTESDNWLLGRALRGAGDATGRRELLSYLLFDEHYFANSFELGRKAAATALAMPWQT